MALSESDEKRNFKLLLFEGGVYIGGLSFISANTVLPDLIRELDGPTFLIALLPILSRLGFLLPAIPTAHIIARQERFMPLLKVTCVLQRLPYLVVAILLFSVSGEYPLLCCYAICLGLFMSGLMGGITLTGWFQLLRKLVPATRLASLNAWRQILTAAISIIAGFCVKEILTWKPDNTGYAILHVITFLCSMISLWLVWILKEEPHTPSAEKKPGAFKESLVSLPGLFKQDKNLILFVLQNAFRNGFFIYIPFFALHAKDKLEATSALMGILIIFNFAGGIAGNFCAGLMGDRVGGKGPMLLGKGLLIISMAATPFAQSEWAFYVIQALLGFGFFATHVGESTSMIELGPPDKQTHYLAIINTISIAPLIAANFVADQLYKHTSFSTICIVGTLTMLLSFIFTGLFKDPRKQQFQT